jgi:hypothetical protein
MDEREIEQGYANFYKNLIRVLRERDVRKFKEYLAKYPMFAGKLSRCFGLNDYLIEVEMYKAILLRPQLKDLHHEAIRWLREHNIEPPKPREKRSRLKGGKGRTSGRI